MDKSSTAAYYGAFHFLGSKKEETGMHVTVFFRHNTTPKELKDIEEDFQKISFLSDRRVRIASIDFLDGPKGEPSSTKVCTLEILKEDSDEIDTDAMKTLKTFSNKNSFRSNLKDQYDYTMHTSIGVNDESAKKKFEEYKKNENTIQLMGAVGGIGFLGTKFIKNMDTKEIILC